MKKPLLFLVKGYRYLISPLLPATCRFYPSCSSYCEEALHVHGAWRGTWLSLRRISRCHPWSEGGVDLVPPRHTRQCDCDHHHQNS